MFLCLEVSKEFTSVNNSHIIKTYLIVKLRVLKNRKLVYTVVGPRFFDTVTDGTKAVKGWVSLILSCDSKNVCALF